ncbi:MAG TPA: alcohol dehydrogenase catalytic domain-containing protein [Vicinamibacterales bacterium]
MRAFQVVEFASPIVPRDIPDPQPRASDVLVEVASCGLCHTDVHLQQGYISLGGDRKLPVSMTGLHTPATLGHEIFGHIMAFGPSSGLTAADVGRPVIVYPWIGCGHCAACLADRDNECPMPQSLGWQRPGGHGERVLVRDAKFLIDAEGLNSDAGIYACCGLTGYAALNKIVRRDGPIGIIGVGGVGLMALSIAKAMSLGPIVAMDIDAAKLMLARQSYGAELSFDTRSGNVGEQIQQATGGLIGVVDFVGAQQTVDLAVSVLRTGGTYVNVGLFGGALQTPLAILAQRQLVLRGSYVGTPAELRELVALARGGRLRAIPIQNEPMDSINEGLTRLRAGKVTGRIVHTHRQVTATQG